MSPRETYQTRADRRAEEAAGTAARLRRLGDARLIAFAAALAFGVASEIWDPTVWRIAAILTLGLFFVLVLLHRRPRARHEWLLGLEQVAREGLLRLDRAWESLPSLSARYTPRDHPYASDLALLGPASLSQLLAPPIVPAGRATLASWLLAPSEPQAIVARQEAVHVLRDELDSRDGLRVHARSTTRITDEELESFLGWAESPSALQSFGLMQWVARIVPATTLALALAQGFGAINGAWWILPMSLGMGLALRWHGRIHMVFRRAFSREGVLRAHPKMFAHAATLATSAPRLEWLATELRNDDDSAAQHLDRLERIMRLADLRYSGMLWVIVQAFTMWDFHVVAALQAWQTRAGPRARRWFTALGEIEALASLAALAHDHPSWTFPEFHAEARVEASQLGHPLLPEERCGRNDVNVGPPGTFLLVTGSNTSGKSTLLRAIGVNCVLAQAGAPVRASALRLPRIELFTSVNVQDSLVDGVSLFFMAELQRMRMIVEAAAQPRDAACLFLLDEILHGTNSAERRIAVRSVLRHLMRSGAIGAITTHDLALADDPLIGNAAIKVHFSESVEETDGRVRMSFDYQLRPGLATSTNALTLMKLVGINPE